jgi:hypothetical protein
MLAVLLAASACMLWAAHRRSQSGPALPWIFFSSMTLLIFILKLGGHFGSYLVYLFQLNLPFTLLATASLAPALRISRPWMAWIFALQALIVIRATAPPRPGRDPQLIAAWQTMEDEAAKSSRLFAPWDLACWQMEHGRELQDSGHRESFLPAVQASRRFPRLFSRAAELEGQAAAVQAREDQDLAAGAYDLVLLHAGDTRHRSMLNRKYRRLGWVALPYPQGKDFVKMEAFQLKSPGP